MELVVKHYSELTADELYDILHVRVLVFVVEQKCPYEEVDGRDRQAYHVFLQRRDRHQGVSPRARPGRFV